jgi:hypothetical protein
MVCHTIGEFVGLVAVRSTGVDEPQARTRLHEAGGVMAKAVWQGQVIAESNDFEVVER